MHSLPAPIGTPAVRVLLSQPCIRCFRSSQPRRRTSITAALTAGVKMGTRYQPGVYELAGRRGAGLTLGRRVPIDRAGSPPDDGRHYVEVFADGARTLIHPGACTFVSCQLDPENMPTVARSTRRPVSTAFTASAVRHPTPVRPLRPTEKNIAAIVRNNVNPETYFGRGFTASFTAGFRTVEDDAALGRFVRRMYPGRRR